MSRCEYRPDQGAVDFRYNRHAMAKTTVLFSLDEAIRAMGVTPERLEKMIEEGKIATVQDGIRTLVPREAILDYLSQVTFVKGRKK
jgi:excisionase family DNA binding protein